MEYALIIFLHITKSEPSVAPLTPTFSERIQKLQTSSAFPLFALLITNEHHIMASNTVLS